MKTLKAISILSLMSLLTTACGVAPQEFAGPQLAGHQDALGETREEIPLEQDGIWSEQNAMMAEINPDDFSPEREPADLSDPHVYLPPALADTLVEADWDEALRFGMAELDNAVRALQEEALSREELAHQVLPAIDEQIVQVIGRLEPAALEDAVHQAEEQEEWAAPVTGYEQIRREIGLEPANDQGTVSTLPIPLPDPDNLRGWVSLALANQERGRVLAATLELALVRVLSEQMPGLEGLPDVIQGLEQSRLDMLPSR